MENYISINDRKIGLTDDQVKLVLEAYNCQRKQLSEFAPGDTVKIGKFEMVVLEQHGEETSLILKDFYGEHSEFGAENNNYDGSHVDEKCREFAQELAECVGWDNIVLHDVDLTSNDGLKDYGTIERRASLLTADLYRKHVEILDKFKLDDWWWLATPWSTKRHDHDACVLCVAPSGDFGYGRCNGVSGVRPFCILRSSIFVSY